ncbi:hypothetical protein [Desulforhopalus sp. 52FAK]
MMKIRLPKTLYHGFPLFCILVGFLAIALLHNPFGIVISTGLYIYAYRILWLRL